MSLLPARTKPKSKPEPTSIKLLDRFGIPHVVAPYSTLPPEIKAHINGIVGTKSLRKFFTPTSLLASLGMFLSGGLGGALASGSMLGPTIGNFIMDTYSINKKTKELTFDTGRELYLGVHKNGHLVFAKPPEKGLPKYIAKAFFRLHIPYAWQKMKAGGRFPDNYVKQIEPPNSSK
ncbi:MAG: hypothetical protein AABX01_01470 [Candidatus Micrarchaeota archaeon]